MNKLLPLLLLISISAFCQIDYQKGYFINNANERIDCYIKNAEWLRSPKEFKYRSEPQSEIQTATIAEVREFGMGDEKYIRAQVDVDQSSSNMKKLSIIRNPEWANETAFLKLLVEGKANLYYFRSNGEDRYFFNVDTNPIKQLVYKKYSITGIQSGTNNGYQNQLKLEMNCRKYTDDRLQQLKYDSKTLETFFIDYNVCAGGGSTTKTKEARGTVFHLKLAPGADFASMRVQSPSRQLLAQFDNKVSFRIGTELEMVLPFNKNKWAITFEPTFQSYKTKDEKTKQQITYQSIEVPLGVRHYFYLNSNVAIFANAAVVFDFPVNYNVTLTRGAYTRGTFSDKVVRINGAAGLGLRIKRFSLEGRYYLLRSGSFDVGAFFYDYQKSSVIVGYRLF